MIPMRHSTIFKSRWMALVWSAGIIWFAVDMAGGKPDSAPDNVIDHGAAPADATLNVAAFDETQRLVGQLNGK